MRALVVASLVAAIVVPGAATATPKARLKPLRLVETCLTRAERQRAGRFTTFDRVRLIGVELGSGPRGVVLAHPGGAGDGPWLCAWMPYARALAAQGYRVLAFDHRGFGSSGSTTHWPRARRVDFDVMAAVSTLRRRGADRVVLAGASLGGAAVLSAAALKPDGVAGVISFAAPQTYVRIDAVAASRALRVPALFLSAEGDDQFPEDARALYEACGSPDRRLEVVPGDRHGAPILREPSTRALVDDWIRKHLGS